jgi:hypothetical protein
MGKIWLFGDYSQAEIRVATWAGPVPSLKSWFENNADVHLEVAKLIGKTVEEHKISLPKKLWGRKPWQELNADDPDDHDNERDLAKRTVHANTNGMGEIQFSIITGLPIRYARIVQDIYHALFPEIRGNYHRWIRDQLQKSRTLVNPQGWKRTFYDIYGPALEREAYAWYPQSTIALLMIKTLKLWCEMFKTEKHVQMIQTPRAIRSMGLDVQLQVHDLGGIVLDDDPVLVKEIAIEAKRLAERPLIIKGETLIVPMDFKTGYSWGKTRKYVV